MKGILNILLFISLLSSVFIACEKDENKPDFPVISGVEITDMTYKNITLKWDVSLNNSYKIIENGICWSYKSNPTIDNDTVKSLEKMGEQNLEVNDLENNKEIFIRVYSTTEYGTTYSDELTFTLWLGEAGEPVTDIDGNVYKTVKIGNQIWMQENLQVKHYNNGDEILLVTLVEDQKWLSSESGMYCKYEDNDNFGDYYGFLYNGYAVTDKRKIAPEGYNIPSENDWGILSLYLGWDLFESYLLMTPTIILGQNIPEDYLPPKQLYNFGGLASGWRTPKYYYESDEPTYSELKKKAVWWKKSGQAAIGISRNDNRGKNDLLTYQFISQTFGLSIRCIKESE